MNESSREKLTDALYTIKNVCTYHINGHDCKKDCPFLANNKECTIFTSLPFEWNINTPDKETWKALL